jgi:hypothetical protein
MISATCQASISTTRYGLNYPSLSGRIEYVSHPSQSSPSYPDVLHLIFKSIWPAQALTKQWPIKHPGQLKLFRQMQNEFRDRLNTSCNLILVHFFYS